ncbi:hypothetical protein INS49_004577 [Diaporthe citri]|uniref:uncharacterized protein n=1 Tax=Diaporthe citri TaxID=83186 RepID=UPI001C7FC5CA|nr:uncharacterized protein INS49_004577 [Diaporthe citri]KAG6354559.1 hypothetical protein INS49_004577 [Diaporthe citri]
MALSVCTPINEMEEGENSRLHGIHPLIKPSPVVAPRYGAKQQCLQCRIRREKEVNYWKTIITRHAKDLDFLPVPPRDFVHREKNAIRSRDIEKADRLRVSLRALLRRERQRELPFHRDNECRRWVLLPMTEKPPEPMPGVPTVTVTDPGGKTWWPKDPNSYITQKESAAISARAAEQHRGPEGEAHCAAFQEAFRKGLDNKPMGMRPEVLYCGTCWAKQVEIEEQEARVAEVHATTKEREAIVEGA